MSRRAGEKRLGFEAEAVGAEGQHRAGLVAGEERGAVAPGGAADEAAAGDRSHGVEVGHQPIGGAGGKPFGAEPGEKIVDEPGGVGCLDLVERGAGGIVEELGGEERGVVPGYDRARGGEEGSELGSFGCHAAGRGVGAKDVEHAGRERAQLANRGIEAARE